MKLLVHELVTSLFQELTADHFVKQVVAVRPHLYRAGAPAGNLTLQIQDALGNVLAESDPIAASAIGMGTYWHGYHEFAISAQLARSTSYRVVLVADDAYSFDPAAYIGWANGFDLGKYEATYTPSNWFSAPLDLEVWTRAEARKGIA